VAVSRNRIIAIDKVDYIPKAIGKNPQVQNLPLSALLGPGTHPPFVIPACLWQVPIFEIPNRFPTKTFGNDREGEKLVGRTRRIGSPVHKKGGRTFPQIENAIGFPFGKGKWEI